MLVPINDIIKENHRLRNSTANPAKPIFQENLKQWNKGPKNYFSLFNKNEFEMCTHSLLICTTFPNFRSLK